MSKARQLNNILFREWDPIGINELGPSDEYVSCANLILSAAERRIDESEIFAILKDQRVNSMKLEPDDERDRVVAASVCNILTELKKADDY